MYGKVAAGHRSKAPPSGDFGVLKREYQWLEPLGESKSKLQ